MKSESEILKEAMMKSFLDNDGFEVLYLSDIKTLIHSIYKEMHE